MKDRKKRAQREEVRRILHEMRLQLAAQRVAQEQSERPEPGMYLNEFIRRAQRSMAG